MLKRLRTSNPRRLTITAILLSILVIALALWTRQLIYEVFVLPISYIFYVAGIIIDTTPQIFFWLAALVLSFWVAYRSLRARPAVPPPIAAGQLREGPSSTGRLLYWLSKVNLLRHYRSSYYQGSFHQALGRLLVEMLAHRQRLTSTEVEESIRRDEIDLPPDVREYARYCFVRTSSTQTYFFRQVWEDVLEFFRIRLRLTSPSLNSNTPSARAGRLVDSVIHYMENELEVPHEHHSQ